MAKTIGVARNHDELVTLLNKRRVDKKLSMLELDHVAGLSDGHVGHITSRSGPNRRNLGKVSLDKLLAALGLALKVIEIEVVEPGQLHPEMQRQKAA